MFPVLLMLENRSSIPGVCTASPEKDHLTFSGQDCRCAKPVLVLSNTGKSAMAKKPSLVKIAFGPTTTGMLVSTPPPELWRSIAFVRLWLVAPSFMTWKLMRPRTTLLRIGTVGLPTDVQPTATSPRLLSMLTVQKPWPALMRLSYNAPGSTL